MSVRRKDGKQIPSELAAVILLVLIGTALYLGYEIGHRSLLHSNHSMTKAQRQLTDALKELGKTPAEEAYKKGYVEGYIQCQDNVSFFLDAGRETT
jgi:hypothetical protein